MSTALNNESLNLYSKVKVLFFGRKGCSASSAALTHLEELGFEVMPVYSGGRGEVIPQEVGAWHGDYIFCFRSLFILPANVLARAKVAAINFHPGPPEYPGSGCLNFALYEDAKQYGVTCHLMNEKVDDGNILECQRFPIEAADNVASLLKRTHIRLFDLFVGVTDRIASEGKDFIKKSLENSKSEIWSGSNRKIKDLDKLSNIDPGISEAVLDKLIRATFTDIHPPRIILHGYEFVLRSARKT